MKKRILLPLFLLLTACSNNVSAAPFTVINNCTYLNNPEEITFLFQSSSMTTLSFNEENQKVIYSYFKELSFEETNDNLSNINTFIGWLNFDYDTSIEHNAIDPYSTTYIQICFDKSGFPYFFQKENEIIKTLKSSDNFDMNNCLKYIIENGN